MTGYKGHLPLEFDREDLYSDANDYKVKCAIAEKLEDIILRKWCVEPIAESEPGYTLDFDTVESLFKYSKGDL